MINRFIYQLSSQESITQLRNVSVIYSKISTNLFRNVKSPNIVKWSWNEAQQPKTISNKTFFLKKASTSFEYSPKKIDYLKKKKSEWLIKKNNIQTEWKSFFCAPVECNNRLECGTRVASSFNRTNTSDNSNSST